MAEVTVAVRSTSCPEGVRDLFMFPSIETGDSGYEITGAAFAMKPRSRGRVSLNDSDPRTPLLIEHGFLSDPHDAEVVAEGFELLRALAGSDPLSRYVIRETRPGPEVSALEHVRAEARPLQGDRRGGVGRPVAAQARRGRLLDARAAHGILPVSGDGTTHAVSARPPTYFEVRRSPAGR